MRSLTRRQTLQAGAAAGLVAMLGRIPSAWGADADAHLRRSSYVPLAGQAFGVAGASLVLTTVGDLDHLAGRDDAFRLELTAASGAVEAGIRRFSHASLGTFELFVAPVCEAVGGVQRYEVIVDRSVPLPGDPPAAPAAEALGLAAPASAAAGTPAVTRMRTAVKRRKKKAVKRKVRLRKRHTAAKRARRR